ncbi:MAG: DUF2523 domain-containing protein [Stenotrophomonas sp.]|uniref:DUF2523 family protein n=1 Tax=Stenotrophomonas maltophilia group TaxID=995085 RepID=UPI0012CBD41A|nr:DUF2523 family protein [Stenotrophomonas maltophilia]MCF3498206.1 DUF2523 domain-containing protein [Stenotrophomonas maltophilia]MDP9617870.1 hypothetical protein [Stenotrophomonas maltophilia]MPS43944.1 DUF2523 domain-containing protein [Stenotrophomonas sp.]
MWAPLLAGLSRLFGTRLGQWILSALAFLGINFITQKFAVDPLLGQIKASVSGAPGDIVAWLGYLNVDKYVTLVLSAYATAAAAGALKMRLAKK